MEMRSKYENTLERRMGNVNEIRPNQVLSYIVNWTFQSYCHLVNLGGTDNLYQYFTTRASPKKIETKIFEHNQSLTRCVMCVILLFYFQQFGPILDVEIIFNERGSKVRNVYFNLQIKNIIRVLVQVDLRFLSDVRCLDDWHIFWWKNVGDKISTENMFMTM